MTIRSIAVGLRRTLGDQRVEFYEARWRDGDLPSRERFLETVSQLFGRVEPPGFQTAAWTEVEVDGETKRVCIENTAAEPERIAAALWDYIEQESQGPDVYGDFAV